jgi:hypothetical protein
MRRRLSGEEWAERLHELSADLAADGFPTIAGLLCLGCGVLTTGDAAQSEMLRLGVIDLGERLRTLAIGQAQALIEELYGNGD